MNTLIIGEPVMRVYLKTLYTNTSKTRNNRKQEYKICNIISKHIALLVQCVLFRTSY